MKSKIKQRIYFATPVLVVVLLALPALVMAQRSAPPLSPILQGYATGGSTANWIDFREGTSISAKSLFTDLKAGFGLGDNDEMRVVKTEADDLGMKHYRYQQYYKNLRVVYGEFIVHENQDGFVKTANGRIITGLHADNNASVNESAALNAALHFVNAKKYLWQNEALEHALKQTENNNAATYFPKGELVVSPDNYEATFDGKDYRVAWCFNIYTDDKDVTAKRVFVDAATGQVILHTDIAMVCTNGSNNGTSAFNGTVSLNTWVNGGPYYSYNDCQATKIITYNCGGNGASTTYYTDVDNVWTDQSAVQAQWGAMITYNYYMGQHSRASWDGANGDLIAYNNAYAGQNNACWGCTGNQAIFYAGNTSAANDDWNTDDIMGHEFTHGVTQASAGLAYNKESGGLNESYSDIFGEMVESWSEGNCDYLVGGDRGAIRSFITPKTYGQPDTYLGTNWFSTSGCTPSQGNDNCGVHTNSGVQNKWFYLVSEGGSGTNDNGQAYNITGITRFKARLIAYRALTMYETSSSQYIDARAATLHAAWDLYGGCSAEIIAVGDAWHAVGVESQSAQYSKSVACGTYSNGEFIQAISQLATTTSCTTTANSTTNTVYFTARDRVILKPGFTAASGSKFVAYLEPCSSTMWRSAPGGGIIMSDPEKGIKPQAPVTAAKVPLSVAEQSGISILPNPFNSTFELSITASQDAKTQVRILNAAGVSVIENNRINVTKGTNKISFDGSKLQKGVYMVEIYQGEVRTVRKIIKL